MSEKKLNYPLNIQLFGEGGSETPPSVTQPVVTAEVDYEKLADVVSKRTSGTEDKVIQGYLKQQGLSPEEAALAMQQYKQTQETKKQEEAQATKQLADENAQLNAQIQNASIDGKVSELALSLKVSVEKIPFLNKLVDRSKAVKEDGSLDEEAIKLSIEEIIKSFPDFKTKQESGFQQVGASGGGSQGTETDARLDAIFGIKK